jgi:formylglycine-generating enzyme required for sulfatase activity
MRFSFPFFTIALTLSGCAADVRDALVTTGWPPVFNNTQGQRLVFITGGTFHMGVEPPQSRDQAPIHRVTVSPFYVMPFEVTKGQFIAYHRKIFGA